ncbi:7c9d6a27-3056-4a28-b4c3-e7c87df2c223 [Thermothielavioides terrestris]|uniref:7c9d6a27-3056-4a28-b4c3-e7c87df2c223 n=1 Tax=Thermothielavioides terrestris TaxID=2587410 RepID=A0A3S4AJL0_9PEZI|nr:7c9d6a27-3056-4a28-b4c3-e7c87df2c223 [Thermothielavioides terrestris]
MAHKSAAPPASAKRKASSGDKHADGNPSKKAKTATGPKHRKVDHPDEDAGSDGDGAGAGLSHARSAPRQGQDKKPKENGRNSGKPVERVSGSREAHAKQKQLAQERKAAKPLADEVQRTKKLWERLRRKSHVPKEERQQLVDELYSIVTGRIKDFVLKHDAVRAVQTAIKYSTPAQRKQIAKELQGSYVQLAESRYAKFLVGKLLVQNDNEIRDLIIPEFYGKVRKLINHPEASWILDDIYRGVATKEQKAHLLREWYGPEFALFKPGSGAEITADLAKILADEPSKRGPAMKYLFDMTNGLIQKKMTGFTMLHDAMLQYFLNLKPESQELKEFVEIVKGDENGDLLKNMAFTKSGARLVCLLLAYGSAKDRKQILKTFKDTFQLMCGDPHGHMVLLAAYDLIDDTVLTSKTIFPEILGKNEEKDIENIIFLANDLNARITVCYLFEGQSKSLFPASHAYDLELLAEMHEIRKKTSKKDPETRRKELVAAMSPPLLAAVAASPKDLVATSFGCQFVTDVLLSATGDKSAALEAVASTAAGDPSPAQSGDADSAYPPPAHISLTPHGGKMFKTLIAGGRFDKASGAIRRVDPPLNFANILYPVIKEHIVKWATGPSSFTVLGLLEAPDFSSTEELLKTLRSEKKALQAAADGEAAAQIESADGKKSKSKSKGKDKPGGNQGARLLLEKLNA